MTTSGIIFIGGIHGAGKTQFCKSLSNHLNLDTISASDLIRQFGNPPSNEQKQVERILEQQDLLLLALHQYRPTTNPMLLDGHFCLLNTNSEIENIPITTFKGIAPKVVIVLTAEVKIIQQRLKNRSNIETYDLDFIAEFQNREVSYAEIVAHQLQVPLMLHNSENGLSEIVSFLQKYSIIEGR